MNTHSFLAGEQLRIVDYLKQQYSIHATIVKDRTKLKIGIGKNDRDRFLKVVRPFIIPSMIYKVVDPRNDLLIANEQSGRVGIPLFR